MQRALIGAILMGALCPLLGVFVVIRRLAFFGDAIAHSAFTGIALGIILGIGPSVGAISFAVLVAAGMGTLQARSRIPSDTIIGVFFSGAAALGILMIGMMQGYRTSLFAYLFGDILGMGWADVWGAAILLGTVAVLVATLRRPLLQIALNRDLAAVQGVRVEALEYTLFLMLAVTVAVSMKLVGIILVTALLVVPAAAARNLSGSIRQMFLWSVGLGVAASVLGLAASYWMDTASGPTIVLICVAFFVVSLAKSG